MAGKTFQLRMAIPGNTEMDALYELQHAAEELNRTNGGYNDTLKLCVEILSYAEEITNEHERAFILKAWEVLVDGCGGLGRLLGAYDTWRHNCQHPGKDYVAWNAKMRDALEADALAEVYREAYEEAQARLDFLVSMFQIIPTEKGINRENPLEDFGVDVEVHPAPHKK